jgi:glycerol-3-phosphate dehydrogenase (NAD(P)+)
MKSIAIIGDGAMALTCATLLSENKLPVRLWTPFADSARQLRETRFNERSIPGYPLPESVEVTADEAAALNDVGLIVNTTVTQYIRPVWKRLAAFVGDTPICTVAKGIENDTLMVPTQIIRDVLDGRADSGRPIAMLSGPCIAPEVMQHKPATVTAVSTDSALARNVQQAFSRPYFRVYTNTDLIGTELAAATKNVIAIAAGILDGISGGDNAKAALLTRGLAEITRLGLKAGAAAETFAGLAGVGDLVTTCISPLGRNRSFGQAIGQGATVEQATAQTHGVVEGVATTASVKALAKKLDVEMPITEAVYQVLFGGQSPKAAISELMARPLKAE